MSQPTVIMPAEAGRVVKDNKTVVLVGQPPEILKNLLLNKITFFDAILLSDTRERDGSLLNNLEFPFYFFVFFADGFKDGRKLKLVGEETHISHALRLLRITLMGPNRKELEDWNCSEAQAEEWLAVSEALSIKDADGTSIAFADFFETLPFKNNQVEVGSLHIDHTGVDQYRFSNSEGQVEIDLSDSPKVEPPYQVQPDYVPGGLVKLGVEVLGGASGFSLHEPCTGLAVCYNGDYLLIDSIPFLDQHLYARGISKNQISAVFLTHLHDDHCSMFPLMLMPNKIEIITTYEIYQMAIDKLSCNLGWQREVIAEHFELIEVKPGEPLNYYGLFIEPHITVHSIPTIGATFSLTHKDALRQLCIVGDNNSLKSIAELHDQGIIQTATFETIKKVFKTNYSVLIADGGAGAIHGDPSDALKSNAERVIFVHLDELPPEFSNIFSLASSGKRYTLFEGDLSINTSQVHHYLSMWLGRPFPNRWMRSLLAQEEIRRFNTDDVIVVQDTDSRGNVYLILTGYCQVVQHDGSQAVVLAQLQAGDLIGEMAAITGSGSRNASVVASTPVTICVFSEATFSAFIETEGFKDDLLKRWSLRPVIRSLPQFSGFSSTVLEKLGRIARFQTVENNQSVHLDNSCWHILCEGKTRTGEAHGCEYGYRPLSTANPATVIADGNCTFVHFFKDDIEALRLEVPQLNYMLRKYRVQTNDVGVNWQLGIVSTD